MPEGSKEKIETTESPEQRESSCVIIITGTNAAGKGTLVSRIVEDNQICSVKAVRYTARPLGSGETNGEEYHFVSETSFKRMISRGEFLEWAQYLPGYYGTSTQVIDELLEQGRFVIIDTDVDSAVKIKRIFDERKTPYVDMYVSPVSLATLRSENGILQAIEVITNRIKERGRGFDLDPEEIEDRVKYAHRWLHMTGQSSHIIENADGQVDTAYEQVQSILYEI